MDHLVRIGVKLCVVPEDQAHMADMDYGAISNAERKYFGLDESEGDDVWEGVAEWMRQKGL